MAISVSMKEKLSYIFGVPSDHFYLPALFFETKGRIEDYELGCYKFKAENRQSLGLYLIKEHFGTVKENFVTPESSMIKKEYNFLGHTILPDMDSVYVEKNTLSNNYTFYETEVEGEYNPNHKSESDKYRVGRTIKFTTHVDSPTYRYIASARDIEDIYIILNLLSELEINGMNFFTPDEYRKRIEQLKTSEKSREYNITPLTVGFLEDYAYVGLNRYVRRCNLILDPNKQLSLEAIKNVLIDYANHKDTYDRGVVKAENFTVNNFGDYSKVKSAKISNELLNKFNINSHAYMIITSLNPVKDNVYEILEREFPELKNGFENNNFSNEILGLIGTYSLLHEKPYAGYEEIFEAGYKDACNRISISRDEYEHSLEYANEEEIEKE